MKDLVEILWWTILIASILLFVVIGIADGDISVVRITVPIIVLSILTLRVLYKTKS